MYGWTIDASFVINASFVLYLGSLWIDRHRALVSASVLILDGLLYLYLYYTIIKGLGSMAHDDF